MNLAENQPKGREMKLSTGTGISMSMQLDVLALKPIPVKSSMILTLTGVLFYEVIILIS